MPQVMVVSSEGYYYSYSIDLENGGECSLLKQYRLVLNGWYSAFSDVLYSLLDSGEESTDMNE
jgi:hypothetical protein